MQLMQKDHLPDHAFWRFIIKIYEQEVAQTAMNQLRPNSAIQLNLLLFCCWFAQAGQGRLAKQDIQDLIAATSAWHDRIVLPLQKLQHQGKQEHLPEDLQQAIAAEVKFAEHIEQWLLIDVPIKFTRSARLPAQKLTDACKNIAAYCKTAQIFVNTATCEHIFHLLAAIFPAIDLLETQKTCRAILLNEAAQPLAQGRLSLD